MQKSFFTVILLFFSALLFSQQTQVTLVVYPGHNYRFAVNDSIQPKTNKILLEPGTYNFKIWAPNYELLDTNLVILQQPAQQFTIVLQLDSAYEAYVKARSKQETNANLTITVPLIAGTALAALGTWYYFKAGATNRDYIEKRFLSNYSVINATELEVLSKRARNEKITNQVLWGASAAGLGFAFTNIILAKNKKVIPYKRTTPELFKNFAVAPAGPNGLYFRKTFYLR